MEGCHAVGGTDAVGHHVVGTGPDELAGLDHQGLRIINIPHVYADVAIIFSYGQSIHVTSTPCMAYLYVPLRSTMSTGHSYYSATSTASGRLVSVQHMCIRSYAA